MNSKYQKLITGLILLMLFCFIHRAQAQFVIGQYASKNKYISNTPFSYFEIAFDGEIKITADDRDIKSMAPGSYLKISKSSFGNKRKLEFRGWEGGKIERHYYEGRDELPFDPDGADWLSDILLEVVRTTGIDAEGRVERFYTKSGVNGVLDEISEIESNTGKGRYFDALLDKKLANDEYSEVANAISRNISSNTERGRLYRNYSDVFLENDEIASSYFKGISRLSSNTERGSILRHTLKKDLTESQTKGLLDVVESLSSNTEKGSILRELNQSDIEKMNLTDGYFDAINSLSSNTE
jgi:hypothetical protein